MKRSRDRDRLHLLRMRDAGQQARQFVKDRNRDDLDNDQLFQLALAKAVEFIGESASHISDELRAQHTRIPWNKIIGMRHVLVLNYWRVEMDVVWETVHKDIPSLLTQLQQLIELEEARRKG